MSLGVELDGETEKEKSTVDSLLSTLLMSLLDLSGDASSMSDKTPQNEVKLVVLRLLSVLMSRTRISSNKSIIDTSIQSATLTEVRGHSAHLYSAYACHSGCHEKFDF